MNCREAIIDIVECARGGTRPAGGVQAHLAECGECRERWESERALTASLVQLRAATATERSSAFRKTELMDEFARRHRRSAWQSWPGAFAAAAVLFALALGLSRPGDIPPGASGLNQIAMRWDADRGDPADIVEISDSSGFVAVPYAPPLATGEFVKVVRTELYAAALDRMGVSVPAGNGEFPAEVVVGEDGLPRAVRVLEEAQF